MKPGAMPSMDICRQMMGDSMGIPVEKRGEMMKAMGDVMMGHARRMQGTEARCVTRR
jgi:hypothetical protein